MIYGIGIDIVSVDRMREVVDKWGERFLQRVYTETEIAYCYEKKHPFPSLAVRFAAKEALIKAMGSGISVSFTDVEVLSSDSGRPFIQPKGRLQDFFRENLLRSSHLSLSHERNYGVALVVIERQDG